MNAKEFDLLRRLIDVGGVRAKALRLALYQMRDAREVTGPAGVTLTTEAKAKLYDIQQRIIRAALAADDRAMAEETYGAATAPASRDTPIDDSGKCPHGYRYEDCCWKGSAPASRDSTSWCSRTGAHVPETDHRHDAAGNCLYYDAAGNCLYSRDSTPPKLSRDHYIIEALEEIEPVPPAPEVRMTKAQWDQFISNSAQQASRDSTRGTCATCGGTRIDPRGQPGGYNKDGTEPCPDCAQPEVKP
jgi:hypothetical protein